MHPVDSIFYWAKLDPRRLAIVLPHMAITYAAMADAIDAVSARIQDMDLDLREPVALAIPDPDKLLVVCFALLRQGVTCAPVSAAALASLRSNNINTVIFSGEGGFAEAGRAFRFDDSWLRVGPLPSVKTSRSGPTNYGDLIFFTSGATGVPKKVIISSEALVDRANLVTMTAEAAHRRILILPGLGSGFGFNRAVPAMHAGRTVCFAYGAETQLRFINTFDIDVIVASVQQASDLVDVVQQGAKYRSESLKEVWVSGGVVSDDLVRRIQTSLCRNVKVVYGSSESGFVASANYDVISHVPGAVGFVLPDTLIEIVDGSGMALPPGEEGLVRGQSQYIAKIFAANRPENAAAAEDAWWYPGDLGRLTEDGILCISGRVDDVINVGGVKIAASSLDETARRYPGIKDAAVCSVRGASGVEEVWVGLVANGRIEVGDFKRSLQERQGDSIRVGEVIIVEKIPRNDLGKLQRHELKALLLGIKNRTQSAT